MDPSQAQQQADFWLKVALGVNTLGTTIVVILIHFWTRGRTSAVDEAMVQQKLGEVVRRIEGHDRLFERAGQKTSDLTDKVQVLVTRDAFDREHRFRSEQIQKLGVDIGTVQVVVGKMEERVNAHGAAILEHAKIIGDFRMGRREYDPTS